MPVVASRVLRGGDLVDWYAGDLRLRLRTGDLLVATRGSAATRLKADGAVEEVGQNVLRFHYVEG